MRITGGRVSGDVGQHGLRHPHHVPPRLPRRHVQPGLENGEIPVTATPQILVW